MAGMTRQYTLRPMAEGDVDPVMRLERALFPGDAWTEGMLRSEMAESTRSYIVAVHVPGDVPPEQGEVVGYAGLRAVPPQGDVQTIAVAGSHWGNGVGTGMLTELLERADDRGVTDMFLDVRSDNPRAQELYRRFGFIEIGRRRNYYRGADAIVMRRSAAPPDIEKGSTTW